MTAPKLIGTLFAAFLATSATAASAEDWRLEREHYVVSVDEKISGDDAALRSANGVIKVDCFAHDGQYHYIISTKTPGDLGAYLFAKGLTDAGVRSLPLKWKNEAFAAFAKEERITLASPVEVF